MRRVALAWLAAALAAGVAHAASGPPGGTVGARVVASPLTVEVVVPAGPVRAGKDFRIRAVVGNAGPALLTGATVSLLAPAGLVLRDPVTQPVRPLDPFATRTVRWDVCAPAPGGYVVLARAVLGAYVAESTAGVVLVTPAKRAGCLRPRARRVTPSSPPGARAATARRQARARRRRRAAGRRSGRRAAAAP